MVKAAQNKRTAAQVKKAVSAVALVLLLALPLTARAMSGLTGASAFAHAASAGGLSSVEIGSGVKFKRYQLVSMLDQTFTVATDVKETASFDLQEDAWGKIVVVQ